MSIPTSCPSCRAALDVPDRLAGKLIRCKTCREEFRVGGQPAADYDDRPRPRPAGPSAVNVTVIAVTIVIGVCVVLVTGVVLWLFIRKVDGPAGGRPVAGPQAPPGLTRPGGAILGDHTLSPPHRPGQFGRPTDVSAGPETVTLSNPRKVGGTIPDRPVFLVEVDATALPADGAWYYLAAKVPGGVSEAHLHGFRDKPPGTLSFMFFPGYNPTHGFEIWIERWTPGGRDDRQRVSPVVRFD